MSRRTVIATTTALFVVIGALAWAGPLTRERTPVAATGTPAPVNEITPVPLKPGQLLCLADIVVGPRTQIAELVLASDERPIPPMSVRVDAPGYRSPVAPLTREGGTTALRARVEPPDRETFGRLCVRNRGTTPMVFAATRELRTYTKLLASIDGEPVAADIALTFYEGREVSALADLSGIVDRMTTSRGFLGAAWLVWLLLAALAVGVPVLALRALASALTAGR